MMKKVTAKAINDANKAINDANIEKELNHKMTNEFLVYYAQECPRDFLFSIRRLGISLNQIRAQLIKDNYSYENFEMLRDFDKITDKTRYTYIIKDEQEGKE